MARTSEKLVKFSRKLRREPTTTEAILLSKLRAGQINGIKFRRQHPIGPFIADFFAASKNIVIEVDGDVHDLPKKIAADSRKDKYFQELGYDVLHFNNDDIINNLNGVLAKLSSL